MTAVFNKINHLISNGLTKTCNIQGLDETASGY